MIRWLIIILSGLGLGAAAGQIENLDGTLPIVGQAVACLAIVVLALWRGLPDRDADHVPDVLQRWPRLVAVLRDWVVPLLLAIAAALGVAVVEGCGGLEVTPGLPGYEVVESESDEDAIPDSARFVWLIETNQGVGVRFVFEQGREESGRYPARGCAEVVDSSGRWVRGWCVECEWSQGFGACAAVDQPAPEEVVEP
jgi:hypothetical protein